MMFPELSTLIGRVEGMVLTTFLLPGNSVVFARRSVLSKLIEAVV